MDMYPKLINVPEELITRNYSKESALPEYRSEFMRDRDRLMYATAFRRLAGKTQIYTVGTDDHKKNRLTHTLEVSQIARTIAFALDLNPDLAEAIALAHDFGHTPFGHAGEQMLHDIMVPNASVVKDSPFFHRSIADIESRFERENPEKIESLNYLFGFKHNIQSARVVTMLEDSYRGESNENIGLNLTNYTLYGMMIHSSLKYDSVSQYPNYHNKFSNQMKVKGSDSFAWSFEAYVVKWADDIAQWHHDLEDAMREGVLPISKICDTIRNSLGEGLNLTDLHTLEEISATTLMDRKCIAELSHIVVNTLVNDLVKESKKNLTCLIEELEEKDVTEAKQLFVDFDNIELSQQKENIIKVSDKIKPEEFRGIIRGSIHHSRNVERMNEKGKYIIRKLFEAYYAHPQQLPDGPILHLLVETDSRYKNIDDAKKNGIGEARVRFENVLKNPRIYVECMLMRRICDHIATMTDHYAMEEYNNLYG